MSEALLAKVHLEPGPRAPFLARRIVAATVRGGSTLRALDAGLLAGELVTPLAGGSDPIVLVISESGRTVRVAVIPQEKSDWGLDEVGSSLLNRLANRWSAEAEEAWFELDLVARRDLTAMTDDQLFALMPGDREARDELFDRYSGFASSIAHQIASPSHVSDDLRQVALAGLVKALDRFDPSFGVGFTTFAGKTIFGELRRFIRDATWPMRVPRKIKDLAVEARRTQMELAQNLGREPEPQELAAALDTEAADLREAVLAGAAYQPEPLDAAASEDALPLQQRIGEPDKAIEIAELWLGIEKSLDRLPERERKILYLRFFEDLTQSEIAEIVGISQMHVSRLLAQSLDEMRKSIEEEGDR